MTQSSFTTVSISEWTYSYSSLRVCSFIEQVSEKVTYKVTVKVSKTTVTEQKQQPITTTTELIHDEVGRTLSRIALGSNEPEFANVT